MKILIAHPNKHHVFYYAKGCVDVCADTSLVVPFYNKGLGRVFSFIHSKYGDKAKGYVYNKLPVENVVSDWLLQLNKMLSVVTGRTHEFSREFDKKIACLISKKQWKPELVITLQDYMPRTVMAAKDLGIKVISDQISNQSENAINRINSHYRSIGVDCSINHDESKNNRIIACADVITAPSMYTKNDLIYRCGNPSKIEIIHYGVEKKTFYFSGKKDISNKVVVMVRANSVRKGGHLFLQALSLVGDQLVNLAGNRKIEFIFLGQLDSVLNEIHKKNKYNKNIIFSGGDIASKSVPDLMKSAHFFVMPSLSEGMSLAACEAMQAGLPLLVTEYVGLDDFITEKMGVLVEDSVESVGDGLIYAFKNIDKWNDWGANCQSAVKGSSWSEYENGVGNMIRERFGNLI